MIENQQTLRKPYFHGTTVELKPGEIILPPTITRIISEKSRKKNLDKVFFTKDPKSAKIYADRAKNSLGGIPVVYEIEPLGTIETINNKKGTSVYMSSSAKVIRKLEQSKVL